MMNRSRLIFSIVSLVIIIGVIAGANHYYFQPKVLLTMPNVEKVKIPEKRKTAFKSDLYAGTMEEILKEKEPQAPPDLLAKTNRNPFLWVEESLGLIGKIADLSNTTTNLPGTIKPNQAKASPSAMEPAQTIIPTEFNLSMVIVGETQNLALVNDQFVKEGSRISGYDVLKIEPGTILLASKDDRQTLTLEPGVPLEHQALKNKDAPAKKVAKPQNNSPNNSSLDFKTQLEQVMKLYSDPNLLLND